MYISFGLFGARIFIVILQASKAENISIFFNVIDRTMGSGSDNWSFFKFFRHQGRAETSRILRTNACYILMITSLPTCTNFRGKYRFWPSITISRFHAVVYRFWIMRKFLELADFILFCFCRYSLILSASCTYR